MAIIKINEDGFFPSITPLWEDFFGKDLMEKACCGRTSSMPAVNIEEKPEAFSINFAAPGMERGDFTIEVDNGILSVAAKKEEKHEEKDKEGEYTRREFRYHTFSRSFALPKSVNVDEIKADYVDGILSLQLPKNKIEKERTVKQIEIG
jgi:HSP20 family protein